MDRFRCPLIAAAAINLAAAVVCAAGSGDGADVSTASDAASAGLTLQPPPTTSPAPGQPGGPPPQTVYWTGSGYGGWQYTSEFGHADLVLTRFGGEVGAVVPLHQRFVLSANLKMEDSIYDWNHFDREAPGLKDPIHDALLMRFAPGFEFNAADHWTIDGGLFIQTAGDPQALEHNATTYGGLLTAKYKFSDNLTAGLGVIAYTELKDESGVLPLVVLDWKITDQWDLTAEDTELRLTRHVDKQTSVYLAGVYEMRQFRLEDSGVLKNGTLTDASLPIRIGVEYAATPALDLSGEVGVIAYEKLTIDDTSNDRVAKDDVNPTVFFGVRADYHF